MRGLNVGVRMGLAHEALTKQRNAKFGGHVSFQLPAPTLTCKKLEAGSGKLEATSQRFALPRRSVPAEDLVLLHRFEGEQTRQRGVVADFHRRVRLAVLRLELVEEVARVRVKRVVLLNGAARVHGDRQLDVALA